MTRHHRSALRMSLFAVLFMLIFTQSSPSLASSQNWLPAGASADVQPHDPGSNESPSPVAVNDSDTSRLMSGSEAHLQRTAVAPSRLPAVNAQPYALSAPHIWTLAGFVVGMLILGLVLVQDARSRGTYRTASCVPEFERHDVGTASRAKADTRVTEPPQPPT